MVLSLSIRAIAFIGFVLDLSHAITVKLQAKSYVPAPAPSNGYYAPWTPQFASSPYSASYLPTSDYAVPFGSSSEPASPVILPPSPTPPYPDVGPVTLSLFGYHHAYCTTHERPPPITAVYLTEDRCIDTLYPFKSFYVAIDQGSVERIYNCQVTVFEQRACGGGQIGNYPVHGGLSCEDLGKKNGRQNAGASAVLTCPIGGL